MQVILFLNEKGGVGKTTLTVHMASALAIEGASVLLIDADPQGHAGRMLGVEKAPGLYDLIVRNVEWSAVTRPISPDLYEHDSPPAGRLLLLPSNVETRNIANSISDPYVIDERLAEVEDAIDYVLIDTSPTASLLHGALYMASDAIVHPVTLEALSFDGLLESIARRNDANKRRRRDGMRDVDPLALIPVMYRAKTTEHRENLAELQAHYPGLVWDPIRLSTFWPEAAKYGRTVWNYAPGTIAADDALMTAQRFCKVVSYAAT